MTDKLDREKPVGNENHTTKRRSGDSLAEIRRIARERIQNIPPGTLDREPRPVALKDN